MQASLIAGYGSNDESYAPSTFIAILPLLDLFAAELLALLILIVDSLESKFADLFMLLDSSCILYL